MMADCVLPVDWRFGALVVSSPGPSPMPATTEALGVRVAVSAICEVPLIGAAWPVGVFDGDDVRVAVSVEVTV
jgi:hypothetical protein